MIEISLILKIEKQTPSQPPRDQSPLFLHHDEPFFISLSLSLSPLLLSHQVSTGIATIITGQHHYPYSKLKGVLHTSRL